MNKIWWNSHLFKKSIFDDFWIFPKSYFFDFMNNYKIKKCDFWKNWKNIKILIFLEKKVWISLKFARFHNFFFIFFTFSFCTFLKTTPFPSMPIVCCLLFAYSSIFKKWKKVKIFSIKFRIFARFFLCFFIFQKMFFLISWIFYKKSQNQKNVKIEKNKIWKTWFCVKIGRNSTSVLDFRFVLWTLMSCWNIRAHWVNIWLSICEKVKLGWSCGVSWKYLQTKKTLTERDLAWKR